MPRRIVLPFVLALSLPLAAAAQGQAPPTVHDRIEALIDRLLGQIEPGVDALAEMLGELSGWYPPEILPNGDILIRRRPQPDAPREPPLDAPDGALPPVTEPFEI